MYSAHNEGKSVLGQKFIKQLMIANFILCCLNKLVYQYNNTYNYSINKKPINADYSALTEKIETNSKVPKL